MGRHRVGWVVGVLVLACGSNEPAVEPSAEQPSDVPPDETPDPPPNEQDLIIEVQYMVDESLSTQLTVDTQHLRDFHYERRGDIGDGTEQVTTCTGTLPDAEREALAAALDLQSWVADREPFTVSATGSGARTATWRAQREQLEGPTPISQLPPSEDALRAMVPTFDRVFRAIREAEGSWAACTTRMDPG